MQLKLNGQKLGEIEETQYELFVILSKKNANKISINIRSHKASLGENAFRRSQKNHKYSTIKRKREIHEILKERNGKLVTTSKGTVKFRSGIESGSSRGGRADSRRKGYGAIAVNVPHAWTRSRERMKLLLSLSLSQFTKL